MTVHLTKLMSGKQVWLMCVDMQLWVYVLSLWMRACKYGWVKHFDIIPPSPTTHNGTILYYTLLYFHMHIYICCLNPLSHTHVKISRSFQHQSPEIIHIFFLLNTLGIDNSHIFKVVLPWTLDWKITNSCKPCNRFLHINTEDCYFLAQYEGICNPPKCMQEILPLTGCESYPHVKLTTFNMRMVPCIVSWCERTQNILSAMWPIGLTFTLSVDVEFAALGHLSVSHAKFFLNAKACTTLPSLPLLLLLYLLQLLLLITVLLLLVLL